MFVPMGEFTFFFVESKTFEFSVEEGGTFYLLPIKKKNYLLRILEKC